MEFFKHHSWIFFVSCHSDEKPESVFGDSVKLSKGMRKTQDKMTKFCLRFSKLELKYGSFYYLLLKVYDYGLAESSQKSLTI